MSNTNQALKYYIDYVAQQFRLVRLPRDRRDAKPSHAHLRLDNVSGPAIWEMVKENKGGLFAAVDITPNRDGDEKILWAQLHPAQIPGLGHLAFTEANRDHGTGLRRIVYAQPGLPENAHIQVDVPDKHWHLRFQANSAEKIIATTGL